MKKFLLILLCAMIPLLSLTACKSKSSSSNFSAGENNNEAGEEYDEIYDDTEGTEADLILKNYTSGDFGVFSDGYAWVKCYVGDSQDKSSAVIDKKGNLYYHTYDDIEPHFFTKGACYIKNGENYSIVDASGKSVSSSETGDFDRILASGDGMFLVYKFDADVDSARHLFGIIDSKGNWTKELTDVTDWMSTDVLFVLKNALSENGDVSASYEGNGVFTLNAVSLGSGVGDYFVWSTKKDAFFSIDKGHFYDLDLSLFKESDHAYFQCNEGGSFYSSPNGQKEKLGFINKVSLDGKLTVIANEDYTVFRPTYTILGGSIVEKFTSGGNVQDDKKEYIDLETRETLNCKYPGTKYLGNNYWSTEIKGSDKKPYFAITDNKFSLKFEPLAVSLDSWRNDSEDHNLFVCGDNKVIYKPYGSETFSIINYDGETLAENLNIDIHYSSPGFSEGLCLVDLDGSTCFINEKGESVIG